jgi:hypothetical protein
VNFGLAFTGWKAQLGKTFSGGGRPAGTLVDKGLMGIGEAVVPVAWLLDLVINQILSKHNRRLVNNQMFFG